MKQRIKLLMINKKSVSIALSFFLPIMIMAVSYYRLGIYPTSDRTILASDAFGQLVNFYSGFNNLLHGEQSFFYTWNGSLGLNFVSLMSYYTNSLFSFLVFFFNNINMPDAMYGILLMKIGSMGITFWIFAQQTFRLPQWIKVSLSVCYALMSFTVAYSIMLMWMDALIYLPLILLGIQRLMDKKKPILLFLAYLLLFVSNYYMAFMVGLFSVFYFLTRLLTGWNRYKQSIVPYFITSLLSGGASMIIILPSIIDLHSNGEKIDTITTFFTKEIGPWDFIIKSMSGIYDTSKFGSGPFISIGLLPLLFFIFYFVSRKIPLKNKLIYGGLVLFMIVSVYIQPLNLIWQGLHSPNMFLFRFSFLYSTLVLIIAGFGLEKFEKEDMNILVNIALSLIGIFILVVIVSNKKRYGYITQESLIVTIFLVCMYILIFVLKEKVRKCLWIVPTVMIACISTELFFNTQQVMIGINKEWGYASRKQYTNGYEQIEPLVEKVQSNSNKFFRLENLDPISRTDSFNYNYSGVTMFSSIRNRHSSQYLDRLGYRSPDTNLIIQYANNTILMDDLLGIKYNIAKSDPKKFGFKKIATQGEFGLYENEHALPLGMLTDQGIFQSKNNRNQTALLGYLSGQEESIVQFTGLSEISRKNISLLEEGDFTYFSEEENTIGDRSITWEVNMPEKTQGYITLDTRYSNGLDNDLVEVTVSNSKKRSSLSATGSYYNIGYYEKAEKIKVTVKFIGSSVIKIIRPSVLVLKTEILDKKISAIKNKEVAFKVKGNKVQAEVALEKEQVIFTTIPYDEGWKAKVDGKLVKIKDVQDALIAINVPKGKHSVQLTYYPKGIKLGSILFVSCVVMFTVFAYGYQRKGRIFSEKNQ